MTLEMFLIVVACGAVVHMVDREIQRRSFKRELEEVKAELQQPQVVNRMALRRQVGEAYLDIDFNVHEGESEAEVIKRMKRVFDLSGTAYELIKLEMEREMDKKRKAVTANDKVVRAG
jgi:hypothetical protein